MSRRSSERTDSIEESVFLCSIIKHSKKLKPDKFRRIVGSLECHLAGRAKNNKYKWPHQSSAYPQIESEIFGHQPSSLEFDKNQNMSTSQWLLKYFSRPSEWIISLTDWRFWSLRTSERVTSSLGRLFFKTWLQSTTFVCAIWASAFNSLQPPTTVRNRPRSRSAQLYSTFSYKSQCVSDLVACLFSFVH